MSVFHWVYVIIVVVLLFGASIFVHEYGHFCVALWRGLKIEGFAIGFGPKLLSWTRKGIEYSLRMIPAGGFVALPQMISSETLEGQGQSNQALPPVSPGNKILVSLAGPFMNLLFAFVIATALYFLGLPMQVNPAIIGGVEPGSGEAKLGLRPGDRIVEVDGKPVTSWEDVQMTAATALTNQLRVTIERGHVRSTYLLLLQYNSDLGLKLLNLEPSDHPVIKEVFSDSAAQKAGLQKDDEVISFDRTPVVGEEQLVAMIKKRPGQPTPMGIKRGARQFETTVVPAVDPATGAGKLGIMIGANGVTTYEVQKPGPLPWQLFGRICAQTFSTISALLHPKRSGVGVHDLSGPPGILAMLAIEVKTDFRLALRFMVLLNISLAFLNLLPLPLLDGGHIALSLFEKIRGRPLKPEVQQMATTLFAFLLISFMLYVSFNDIVRRFPLFRSMFEQPVQIEKGNSAH